MIRILGTKKKKMVRWKFKLTLGYSESHLGDTEAFTVLAEKLILDIESVCLEELADTVIEVHWFVVPLTLILTIRLFDLARLLPVTAPDGRSCSSTASVLIRIKHHRLWIDATAEILNKKSTKWWKTYQTEIQEDLLDRLYVLAAATDNLSLEHALENFGNEALTLHLVLNLRVVAETGLDKVLKEQEEKLLGVWLLTNLKLVWDFVQEDDHAERQHWSVCKAVLVQDTVHNMWLKNAEATELILGHRRLNKFWVSNQRLKLLGTLYNFWNFWSSLTRYSPVWILSTWLCICSNLVWSDQFLIEYLLDFAHTVLAVEWLRAIGLDILSMQQTLKNTVCKTSVTQILEAWKLQEVLNSWRGSIPPRSILAQNSVNNFFLTHIFNLI